MTELEIGRTSLDYSCMLLSFKVHEDGMKFSMNLRTVKAICEYSNSLSLKDIFDLDKIDSNSEINIYGIKVVINEGLDVGEVKFD